LPRCEPPFETQRFGRFFISRISSPGSKLKPVLAFLFMLLIASAAPADVAGNWRVEFVVPTGEMAVNMTINQNGTKLSGRVVNEDGEFPLEGSVADDQVTVSWVVPEQGSQVRIIMKGTVEGEYISGTARLGDIGEGSLSARRMSRNP
jgi:hypothetical protein